MKSLLKVKSPVLILTLTFLFVFHVNFIRAQNFAWAKNFGSAWNDKGVAVTTDNFGNVYMTGTFSQTVDFDPSSSTTNLVSNGGFDIFIAKYTNSGSFVWAVNFGGTCGDEPYDIKVDLSGNVYVTGYFNSSADFDPGPGTVNLIATGGFDIFLLSLNSNGNFRWAGSIGGNDFETPNKMAVYAGGNIFVTGEFWATAFMLAGLTRIVQALTLIFI